ncbi:MAG: TetR/AcrR family transcriptional regulator [Myxococcales bacterium]|nr:TetR/AcrR family transcriptional regulator [Myxococcales bacterium]
MIHEVEATPRARRREANLERILDTALEVVAREGLEGLQMARLAAAVDYTPGALYRYVESKDALVALLVTRTLGQVEAALRAVEATVPARATPLARVAALVAAYRGFVRGAPHRFGLLAVAMAEPRILVGDPEHTRLTAAAVVAALTPVAAALDAAATAGALDAGAAIERTLCVFAMVHGLSQLPKMARAAPTAIDVDAIVASGLRALLIGWGAAPRSVDHALRASFTPELP